MVYMYEQQPDGEKKNLNRYIHGKDSPRFKGLGGGGYGIAFSTMNNGGGEMEIKNKKVRTYTGVCTTTFS